MGRKFAISQILEDRKVVVNFERPTEDGFDSARCELPSYTWLYTMDIQRKKFESLRR